MIAVNALLAVHVGAGFLALTGAIIATATMFFDFPHKWHVFSGKMFVFGMAGIVVTAIPITLIKSNYPLLLIAVFSGYLALAGWRYAKNRTGVPNTIDWVRVGVMTASSILMLIYGAWMIHRGDLNGIMMIVFGSIGGGLCLFDTYTLRTGRAKGKTRVALHLTMMLSGLIATVTAFAAVNFTFEPLFVVWLTPTLLITPIIVWWNMKIEGGRKPSGMPESDS
jgi:hypothetical protein